MNISHNLKKTLYGDRKNADRGIQKELEMFTILQLLLTQDNTLLITVLFFPKPLPICSESVTIPLKIIFEESLKKGIFPQIKKKAIVVPVYKKEDKTLIKNYRPITLLPILSKIFERSLQFSV